MDSSMGGISEDVFILKYNAMRYTSAYSFAQVFSKDLSKLIEYELRRKTKLIKTLRNKSQN